MKLAIELDERTYGNLVGFAQGTGMTVEEFLGQAITLVVSDFVLGLSKFGDLEKSIPEGIRQGIEQLVSVFSHLTQEDGALAGIGEEAEEQLQKRLSERTQDKKPKN